MSPAARSLMYCEEWNRRTYGPHLFQQRRRAARSAGSRLFGSRPRQVSAAGTTSCGVSSSSMPQSVELLRHRGVEQQRQTVARRRASRFRRPERAVDHRDVVAEPGHAPQIGHAVRLPGSAAAASASISRIEVLQVRQLRLVERQVGAGRDLPRHKRAGRRHDDIVAGMAGEQFRFEHLVAVIDVVGDRDAGFLREIGDRVGRDVVGPVIDVQPLFLGGRAATAHGRDKRGGRGPEKGSALHDRSAYSSAGRACQ